MSNNSPFLQKLRRLSESLDPCVGGWDERGQIFEVKDSEKFSAALRSFFKGTEQTFTRQLHFYDFKKTQLSSKSWSFQHPLFVRDSVFLQSEIKRKTKVDPDKQRLASAAEIKSLKAQVDFLQSTVESLSTKLEFCCDLLTSKRSRLQVDDLTAEIQAEFESEDLEVVSQISMKTNVQREDVEKIIKCLSNLDIQSNSQPKHIAFEPLRQQKVNC